MLDVFQQSQATRACRWVAVHNRYERNHARSHSVQQRGIVRSHQNIDASVPAYIAKHAQQ